ncbi:MAG: tetratricopeptide repeat protein [Spirochaetaceae bacterium]|jgi:tetratricopeptide (TPR) repeat protein|nr:tetratricopeptide repeat protein [Spirochaetaceae bacterium]
MENRQENLTIDDFTKMISTAPNNYNFYVYRGMLYWSKGDFDKAKDDFTKAIQINPFSFEAYNNRGSIYGHEKNYDLALTDYSKCVEINQLAIDGYVNRGSFYCDMLHDYKSAIEDFSRAIEIDPTDYEVYLFRCRAYMALGEEKLAETDLKKAFEINPFVTEQWLKRRTEPPLDSESAEAHIQNVVEALGSHEYDFAIAEATEAIKIGSPLDAIAYSNRGIAHDAKGEYALAIEDCKKALALSPEYTKAYSNLGITYYHIRKYDLAIENITQTIERLSKNPVLDPDETKTFLKFTLLSRTFI